MAKIGICPWISWLYYYQDFFPLENSKNLLLLENCVFLFTVLPTCFVPFHKEVSKVRWICQSTLHQLSSLNFSTHIDNCRFVLIKLKTHLTHCAFRWYLFDRQKHKYQCAKRQTSMLERDENPFVCLSAFSDENWTWHFFLCCPLFLIIELHFVRLLPKS